MKKIFLFLYLSAFSFGFLLCQSTAAPTISQFNTQIIVNPFDPLIKHINQGNINSVIIELTKGGVVNEARRDYALSYLKERIETWKGRKDTVWKSPDLLLALTGLGFGIAGFIWLANYKISKRVKGNESFKEMEEYYTSWKCPEQGKIHITKFNWMTGNYDGYHVWDYCDHCKMWLKSRPLTEKEDNMNLAFGLLSSIGGYLLYQYAKKCPIANDSLSRLINMEYFVKLLPVAKKAGA